MVNIKHFYMKSLLLVVRPNEGLRDAAADLLIPLIQPPHTAPLTATSGRSLIESAVVVYMSAGCQLIKTNKPPVCFERFLLKSTKMCQKKKQTTKKINKTV